MLPEPMTARRATLADVPTLTAFGRRIFAETFGPDNRPEHLQTYLDSAYVAARQEEEVTAAGFDTLLLECEGVLAAFAQLRAIAPPEDVTGAAPLELWRFYVDAPWQGKGVAQQLMRDVEQAARVRGARTVWLGVWERNVRAQAFYRKHGFTVVGSQIFHVGADPQRDLLMAKSL